MEKANDSLTYDEKGKTLATTILPNKTTAGYKHLRPAVKECDTQLPQKSLVGESARAQQVPWLADWRGKAMFTCHCHSRCLMLTLTKYLFESWMLAMPLKFTAGGRAEVSFHGQILTAMWPQPWASGSCSSHELTTNSAIGVSRLWPSTQASATGTLLRFFQTISENTSFWQLKRLVTLSTYRRYTNNCIYLSLCLSVCLSILSIK